MPERRIAWSCWMAAGAVLLVCSSLGAVDGNWMPQTTATAAQCSQTSDLLDMMPRNDWCCDCWNMTETSPLEMHCRCRGLALLRVPQKLPSAMQRLTVIQAQLLKLRFAGLQRYAETLQDIMLTDVPAFETIESGALSQCRQLRTLYISQAPSLSHLPYDVFEGIPDTFRSLRIINSGLQQIPEMKFMSTNVILHMVDLEGNQIVNINERAIQIKTEQLILDNNPLEYINKSAFEGSEIAKLSLKGNTRLTRMHPAAFAGILHVQELDLSSTALQVLPTEGLTSLEILRIQNTHTLRTIPSVYHFKNLRVAWLTHPFHCCAFKFPSRHDPQRYRLRQVYLAQMRRTCIDKGLIDASSDDNATTTIGNFLHTANDNDNVEAEEEWGGGWSQSVQRFKRYVWHRLVGADDGSSFAADDPNDLTPHKRRRPVERYESEHGFFGDLEEHAAMNAITGVPIAENDDDDDSNRNDGSRSNEFRQQDNAMDFGVFLESEADIQPEVILRATCGNLSEREITLECYPKPDALNPCEDVMGSQWLRICVWVVVWLAVVGNVAVLVVLISSCKDVTVTKFLMSNLAFADLCLGLYLLLIAAIDAHSIGEYFNYGYDWQYGFGCQAAGFLTVFASHLSVYTLCIITLERWYAITNAMHLNKRINMRTAVIIMLGGWSYACLMSALPLMGISNYSSTSICLPMEARDTWDVAYLVVIIANSGLAFCFIAVCYGQIYMSLGEATRQAHRHASRTEMTVAKKMALLVFTNFVCWAPIAFFALTAVAGAPLITVAQSKVLLVFFYPLNSCADPYLYAILTAQYRRDLYAMLGRCGLCRGRARHYNENTMPMLDHTTNLTSATSATTRRSSSMDRSACGGSGTTSRKISRTEFVCRRNEEFV